MSKGYSPPFTITTAMLTVVESIGEAIGMLEVNDTFNSQPQLRRMNRIRTIQGSLSIEGNTMDIEQVSAIIDGKKVIGIKREIQEVRNAIKVYDILGTLAPGSRKDILNSCSTLFWKQ
jgi:Fic family protein